MPTPSGTPAVTTGKIERKMLAHYLNATPTGATATYERLGKDLDKYEVGMNAEVEKKKNILGETSITLSSYEVSGSVDTYYAEKGSKLFDFLQDIVDNRKTLDNVKTTACEVHTWDGTSGAYVAYEEEVYIEPKSYGGDTKGYQIPFDIHYTGKRVKGTFDEVAKKFTKAA